MRVMRLYAKKIILSLLLLNSIICLCEAQEERLVKYSGEISVTAMPTFSQNGEGMVGLFETCHGFVWGNNAYFGIGTGVSFSFLTKEVFIPAFIEGRFSPEGEYLVTPFCSLRLGGLFCTQRISNLASVNPTIGVTMGRISFSVGYQLLSGIDKDYLSIGMGRSEWVRTPVTNHGITFRISYTFRNDS